MRHKFTRVVVLTLFILGLAGCAGAPIVQTLPPIPTAAAMLSATPIMELTPTAAPATPTPVPLATSTEGAGPRLCSPLEGMPLSDLPKFISSPFEPATLGQDNGHHGVDFAFYRYGDRVGMTGTPIHAVIAGVVTLTLEDTWPYGYVIIIETPLEDLPSEWLPGLKIPEPIATVVPGVSALTLPPITATPAWNDASRSLYVLYAHLNEPPMHKRGDVITCGELLGVVGNTGRSSAPHLHVELRVGPADLSMTSMEHYDNGATDEEMFNYYTWRVSGLFQVFDTMNLLTQQP